MEGVALSPALKDFISGAVAGAFAITVSQPLDTVRVRLQQAGSSRNALGVLLTMVRQEGALSPFKGLTYPLLFASVQSAILFQAYGWTLRQMASLQPQPIIPQQPSSTPPPNALPTSSSQPRHPTTTTTTTTTTSSARATSSFSPSPPAASPASALHEFHLHHHHHYHYQELGQQVSVAAVHRSPSVSGQVLAWVAARVAPAPLPAGNPSTAPVSASQPPLTRTLAAGAAPADVTAAVAACSGDGGDAVCSSGLEQVGTGSSSSASCGGSSSCSGSSGTAGGGGGVAGSTDGRSHSTGGGAAARGAAGGSGNGSGHPAPGRPGSRLPAEQQQQAALPTPWHGFVAGSVAGFAQVFLWSPVELLKLRAQLQTATPGSAGYRNPAALATQVLRMDGVAGLYRGFTLTVIRDVPSYAMYFWLYHDIAGALSPGMSPEAAPPATQVVAGGMAGVVAWLPIYPLDVLKTRVQAVSSSASRGLTWMHFARELYKEAGARAFFRGVAPTLVRAFMMDGASFLGYTTTLKLLGGGSGGGALEGDGSDGGQAERQGMVTAAAAAAHV